MSNSEGTHRIALLSAALGTQPPCGPNLEYDPDFLALERLAKPQEERGVGDTVRQAQEPEWKEVARLAESLAERTRDLRVSLYLAHAWLARDGIAEFAEGLALLRCLLEDQWADVHPIQEDDDPTERINALAALSADPGILGSLRYVTVIALERIGSVRLRDLRLLVDATANDDADDKAILSLADHVQTVLGQAGEDRLLALDASAALAIDHLEAIAHVFATRTPGMGPGIDPLVRELGVLRKGLRPYLSATATETETDVPGEAAETGLGDAVPPTPAASAAKTLDAEEIRRRLDEICAWYAANEPASPVPVVLRRARGLIGMDFAALLQAVAPGGLSEFRSLAGTEDD